MTEKEDGCWYLVFEDIIWKIGLDMDLASSETELRVSDEVKF